MSFDCWHFKPHSSFLAFSPACGQADEKVWLLPPLVLMGQSSHTSMCLYIGALKPTSLSNHCRTHAGLLSLLLQDIFSPAWQACPALLRTPHHVSNKPFHTLLCCVISLDIPTNFIIIIFLGGGGFYAFSSLWLQHIDIGLNWIEPRFLGEMAKSRSGARKMQGKSGIFVMP